MRTTLIIPDDLVRALKRRAAEEQRTLSEVTAETLRLGLARAARPRPGRRPRLRSFAMGRPAVDIADRDQLYDVLDRP